MCNRTWWLHQGKMEWMCHAGSLPSLFSSPHLSLSLSLLLFQRERGGRERGERERRERLKERKRVIRLSSTNSSPTILSSALHPQNSITILVLHKSNNNNQSRQAWQDLLLYKAMNHDSLQFTLHCTLYWYLPPLRLFSCVSGSPDLRLHTSKVSKSFAILAACYFLVSTCYITLFILPPRRHFTASPAIVLYYQRSQLPSTSSLVLSSRCDVTEEFKEKYSRLASSLFY